MASSKVDQSESSSLEESDLSNKGAVESNDKESNSSPTSERAERSPSPEVAKCAICLSDVQNRSRSNNCVHPFCFTCLLEWSKVKPECPLCKSTFTTIYHNFRSNNDHDEYVVPTPAIPHFSIRFTASATAGNYRFSPYIRVSGHPQHHTHLAMVNTYDGGHIPAGTYYTPTPRSSSSTSASGTSSNNPFNNGASVRPEFFGDVINDHQRNQEEANQMPGYQNRRRRYDRNEWVQPFGSTLQPGSVIFPSLQYIRTHPTAIPRLRTWLFRELSVLLGLQRSREQMAFVYDLIIHIVNHYDIRSRDFRDMMSPYFGERTGHFQHELYHFILSGMSMEEFDRVAEYPSTSSYYSGARGRNMAPEIITLDSDDDTTNSNPRIPPTNRNNTAAVSVDDVVILSSSDEEEVVTCPVVRLNSTLRSSRILNLNPMRGSRRTYASAASSNGNGEVSEVRRSARIRNNGSPSLLSIGPVPAGIVPAPVPMVEIPAPEPERPRRRTTNRTRALNNNNVDPEMPILEPEVSPFDYQYDGEVSNEAFEEALQLCANDYNSTTTIDRARATAAITAVSADDSASATTHNQNQNVVRPSVLSRGNSSASANTPVMHPLASIMNHHMNGTEIDVDLDVSVEPYSSPTRHAPRPLTSPDFPILRIRGTPSAPRERPSSFLDFLRHDIQETQRRNSYSSVVSGEQGNGSAFVPYAPETIISYAPTRPPRPSCIHESGSNRSNLRTGVRQEPSASSTSTSAQRSTSPAFRVNLYPNGISSSQVMDLSRSAGLIPSVEAANFYFDSNPPEVLHVDEPSSPSPPLSPLRLPRLRSLSPVRLSPVGPPSPSLGLGGPEPFTINWSNNMCSYNTFAAAAESFNQSLAAAAGSSVRKPDNKKATENKNNVDVQSDDDELECLGSFPIEKKPPLAVITLSSDDEEEDRRRVKAERNENAMVDIERLGSDEDGQMDDLFMMNVWGLNGPIPETVEEVDQIELALQRRSGNSTASGSNVSKSNTASASHTQSVDSNSDIAIILDDDTSHNSGSDENTGSVPSMRQEPVAGPSGTHSRSKKNSRRQTAASPPKTPKRKSKRLRISSSSEDDVVEEEEECIRAGRSSRRDRDGSLNSSSASSTPVKIPKKRRYIESDSSSSPVVIPPHFTSSESEAELSGDSDEDYVEVQKKKKKSKSSKKHNQAEDDNDTCQGHQKKKHKSKKSKKSKKSSRDKSKEKESRKRKDRSGSSKREGAGDKTDEKKESSSASCTVTNVEANTSSGSGITLRFSGSSLTSVAPSNSSGSGSRKTRTRSGHTSHSSTSQPEHVNLPPTSTLPNSLSTSQDIDYDNLEPLTLPPLDEDDLLDLSRNHQPREPAEENNLSLFGRHFRWNDHPSSSPMAMSAGVGNGSGGSHPSPAVYPPSTVDASAIFGSPRPAHLGWNGRFWV